MKYVIADLNNGARAVVNSETWSVVIVYYGDKAQSNAERAVRELTFGVLE
jgi:hypothetical protein